MKSLLTNTPLIVTLALVTTIGSVAWSAHAADWTWFTRFGGFITLLGGLLATRRIIRLGVDDIFRDDHTVDGGSFIPTPEELESSRQDRLDIIAAKWAFGVVSSGTIIWAFGDLLGGIIH